MNLHTQNGEKEMLTRIAEKMAREPYTHILWEKSRTWLLEDFSYVACGDEHYTFVWVNDDGQAETGHRPRTADDQWLPAPDPLHQPAFRQNPDVWDIIENQAPSPWQDDARHQRHENLVDFLQEASLKEKRKFHEAASNAQRGDLDTQAFDDACHHAYQAMTKLLQERRHRLQAGRKVSPSTGSREEKLP